MNTGKNGWFYKACENCPKKVDPKENNMWECTKCNKITSTFAFRYKIEIVVYDEIATLTLFLWDNEVVDLVGVKAPTLIETIDGDKDGYPNIVENLYNKRLLFKVSVKERNISGEDTAFRVMKICDDEDLVDRYYPKDDAADNKFEYNPAETGGSNEVDFPASVVSLQNDTDSQLNLESLGGSAYFRAAIIEGHCTTRSPELRSKKPVVPNQLSPGYAVVTTRRRSRAGDMARSPPNDAGGDTG
ncbi:hypothetical protein PIB30_007213 [Stylosanthes scabra]|uniref:Replication factor A C-terminal domain-containing protein n=1 Tax=Stylosanthes scabra TaxID=79078 RepID=A0ABU6V7J9_9FABA|nr:hypothetical protein [Stylosanthes scabra]